MIVLAVDPGNTESAYVLYDCTAGVLIQFGKVPNARSRELAAFHSYDHLAVEMIASYGMPVGAEVFETCVEIGRLIEIATPVPCTLVYRRDVKLHLCGQSRAKDGNVRAAIIDRFGPGKEKAIGTKRSPGLLYGVHSDIWQALAVALCWSDAQADRAELLKPAAFTGSVAELERHLESA